MSARVPVTPIDAAEISTYDHVTDVLVIGYGCAGASAALEADAGGAEVILLERQSGGGGSSALSGGEMYLGGGTAIQERVGSPTPPRTWKDFCWLLSDRTPTRRRWASTAARVSPIISGSSTRCAVQAFVVGFADLGSTHR